MKRDYDMIVIGTGPGGEGAALKASKEGKQAGVIEMHPSVGGNCTHLSTIPSKSLRQAVQHLGDSQNGNIANYQDLLMSAESIVKQQVELRRGFYDRNLIEIIHGRALFIDDHTVKVELHEGGQETFTAEGFVIATGARPYHPEGVNFSHPRILDSDTILKLKDNPRSLTIYGAGVVGCEYASIFRRLKVKINLINNRDQLLSYLDDEIIDALSYHLREQGILIRHNEMYEKVEADDNGVRLFLKSNKQIQSDYILWAEGRTGNSDDMGLESIGIEINERGSIVVNENYQSAIKNIYAVGDVVGYPSLASAAYDQGRFAATHLIFGECEYNLVDDIPTGIYTIPEISSIGMNERDLTAKKISYEVGHAFFRHLARAQITGQTTGMLKILFHRETLAILGIHCFGAQASEIVHIGQAIMAQNGKANTLMYFINTTFNYPTMAEAYRVAALNGLNRLR